MPGQTMYSPSLHYSTGIDHSYELDENNLQNPMPAFHFRKRFGDINWRKISSIDVDRVARELDFVTLQENISTVAFCNVDAVSDLDPLFVKLFKLAQFTIEYLLHSQEYLQSVINDMESRVATTNDEKAAVEAQLVEANAEITKLKQENKKRRKMIEQQQLIIEAGASSYYKCPHCEKAFMNASFLQGHIQRRHPGSVSYIGDVIEHSKREQAKLSDNLKQLESDLQKEKDNFHHRLREAESEKLRWAEESRVEMNRWKEEEETKWKEELKTVKDSFLEDIEKLKDKEEEYRKTIGNLQETMEIRQSNLGELVDDVEVEKTKMKDYEGRMRTLEEINDDKSRQIESLTSAIRKLRREQSNSHQQEAMLKEYGQEMKILKNKVKRNNSDKKMAKLQEQIKQLTSRKSETKPKVVYAIEDDESEEEEADGFPDREGRKQELASQMKSVLISMLEEKIYECGIDPTATGISNTTLTNKLMVRKTERQQKAKEIPQYYQIREDLRRKVDQEANKRGRKSFPKSRSATLPRKKAKPDDRGLPKISSQPDLASSSRKPTQKGSLKPARRNLQSTPIAPPRISRKPRSKSQPEEIVSPWDSQDESEISHLAPPTGRKEESDWEDVDDLMSTDENRKGEGGPDGRNVRKTGAAIEQLLSQRQQRPPVGGVDTMPIKTKIEEFDDDDSFHVSSLEDEEDKPVPAARPNRSKPTLAPRQSLGSNSTATYGTSVWGSGANKGNDVGNNESDWDDSELDELMA